jgi:hypothetical protein
MDKPVEHGVGDGGIADVFVPMLHGNANLSAGEDDSLGLTPPEWLLALVPCLAAPDPDIA